MILSTCLMTMVFVALFTVACNKRTRNLKAAMIYIVLFFSFCGWLGIFLQGVHGQYWLESEVQVKEKEYGQVYAAAFFYCLGPIGAMLFSLNFCETMVNRYKPGFLNSTVSYANKGLMAVLFVTYLLLAILLACFMERLRWCATVLPDTKDDLLTPGTDGCDDTMFLAFLNR